MTARTVNRPNNAQEIYLKELGSESPMLVRLIMKSIHKQNKREVKHIGCKRFGIQYLLERHLHAQRLALFPHGDKEPEQRAFRCGLHHMENRGQEGGEAYRRAGADYSAAPCAELRHLVPGKKSERTVFTMAKFTIPDDKCLVVELNEKNGGRHQSFVIENEDLVRANTINELQVR